MSYYYRYLYLFMYVLLQVLELHDIENDPVKGVVSILYLMCVLHVCIVTAERSFKDIIKYNMPDFTKYTDIPSLVPYLYKYQLLTPDEHQQLLQQTTSEQSIFYYAQVLRRKGAKAHVQFYMCLNEAVKDPHCSVGHCDLLKLFNR